jgi:hypothetical protein
LHILLPQGPKVHDEEVHAHAGHDPIESVRSCDNDRQDAQYSKSLSMASDFVMDGDAFAMDSLDSDDGSRSSETGWVMQEEQKVAESNRRKAERGEVGFLAQAWESAFFFGTGSDTRKEGESKKTSRAII